MNEKGFVNVIVLFIVAVILTIGIYFAAKEKAVAPVPTAKPILSGTPTPTASSTPTSSPLLERTPLFTAPLSPTSASTSLDATLTPSPTGKIINIEAEELQ